LQFRIELYIFVLNSSIMTSRAVPQYRRLYLLLRKHIVDGVYREGDMLPSENELCVLHELTRPTVRKAMDMLVHEGFIRRHQGKGSIVHKLPKGIGILSISGTTKAIGKDNLTTQTITRPHLIEWPEDFPFSLSDYEKESGCIYFSRLRLVNGSPVFFDITYLPNINLPRFTSRNLENKSLFDILRSSYSLEVKGGEQYIKAMNSPDREICNILGVNQEQPVLHLQRKMDTSRLNYYIYSILYCNTNEHSLYGIF